MFRSIDPQMLMDEEEAWAVPEPGRCGNGLPRRDLLQRSKC